MRDKIKKLFLIPLFISYSIFAQEKEDSIPSKAESKVNNEESLNLEKQNKDFSELKSIQDKTDLTQTQIRERRKIEISIGQSSANYNAYFTGHDRPSLVKAQYNFTSRFSFGFTYIQYNKNFTVNTYLPDFISGQPPQVVPRLIKNHLEAVFLNIKYYFFENFPIYITSSLGKNFVGLQQTMYSYNFEIPLLVIRQIDQYPCYSYFIGLGFQWIFKNGFLVGLEGGTLQTINASKRTYSTFYTNAFINSNYIIDSLILDAVNTHKQNDLYAIGDFWVGYSFPL